MSEQIIDLRSVWAIFRRHTRALAVAAVVGGVAGGAALQVMPSEYSSSAQLLFPPPAPAGTAGPVTLHAIDTQAQIATSSAVMQPAGQALHPALGAQTVADRVTVESPTEDVLTITARGATAGDAERLATAVATADIAYLQLAASGLSSDERAAIAERKSTLDATLRTVRNELNRTTERLRGELGDSAAAKVDAATLAQLTARQADLVLRIDALDKQAASQAATTQPNSVPRLVGPASPAQAQPALVRWALFVGLGAAGALLLGGAIVILRGRRDKALRSRDQIADSIGVPVVASVQSRTPRSVAGWMSLLRGYAPGSADGWALHQLLQRFTFEGGAGAQPGPVRRGHGPPQEAQHRSARLLVLTLADDPATLAVGPQLASFAAGSGRQTRLVTASHRHQSTDSLRAACSRIGSVEQPRPGLLVNSLSDALGHGELVVHSVTVSRQHPETDIPRLDDAVVLLAVSSGGASAEDLARAALAADEAGVPLDGIIVANPDPLDRTTGRLLPADRAVLAPLPSLMTGASEPAKPRLHAAEGTKR